MNCRHCGAEIGDHEKFCRYCGKAQQKTCPKCGAQLSDTAKFCNHCGAALEAPAKAPKAKPKRPWGLIAVIAVLCVALIGGGIFAVKTFTDLRDRQQELENQLSDRDEDDRKDRDDKKDDRDDPEPEPAPEPAPDEPTTEAPDAPAVNETPAERPQEPAVEENPALPYRPEAERPGVDFDEFYVGLVLAGRKVYGQNADIYQGVCDIMAELGLEDSRIQVVEECATPEAGYNACQGLASSGCGIIVVAANLYDEWDIMLAEEFPDTVFVVLGGTSAAVSGLPNLVNAWPQTHEMWYIAGAAAGAQLMEDMAAGNTYAPFAAFFTNVRTTQAISDYSAFYLGMKTTCPDAILFTFQHYGDPDMEREMIYEAAWGIGCSILVEHRPNGSILPDVVNEIEESGQVCHAFTGNMDPIRLNYEVNGMAMEIHWSYLFGEILWDYVEGEPMDADYTLHVSDGMLTWHPGSTLCESAMAAAEEMTVKLQVGEPVFITDEFTCYSDGVAAVENGHVVELPIWDTDFDGTADYGNAVQDGVIMEGAYRSAPVFNLQIEGIEVLN